MQYEVKRSSFVPQNLSDNKGFKITIKTDEAILQDDMEIDKEKYRDMIFVRKNNIGILKQYFIKNYTNLSCEGLLYNGKSQFITLFTTCNDSKKEISLALHAIEELKDIICEALDRVVKYENEAEMLENQYKAK